MTKRIDSLPKTMQAVQVHAYDAKPESLKIVEVPTPQPGPGQVLIKVAATPINPSDLLFIRGQYGIARPTPTTAGFEAAGVVVAAGSGPFGKRLIGKRVAFGTPQTADGTWAEYAIGTALECIKLPNNISDEQGAMLLANPITAIALLEEAKSRGHKAAIHTAAASALGRILLTVSKKDNFPVIHIVRRSEQEKLLKDMGGKYVLNSSDPAFHDRLKQVSGQLQATIAFDAVSGDLTGQLINAMPEGSAVLIYGVLSSAPMQIDPHQLIFTKKTVEGFWLPNWIKKKGPLKTISTIRKAVKLMKTGFASPIAGQAPLSNIHEVIAGYEKNMTKGKMLLVP